ncbi:MAG: GNAT family N-acetyltransferase, partial [Pseudomonadota bacterium]
ADFAAHHRNGELEIIEWQDASEGSGKAAWAGYAVTILTPNTLFIDNIALLDAFRGRGIARMLFEALTVRARSHGCVALELYTNAKMTENLALYPRLGFRETDRRVENGFDRVFFQKDVGEGSDDGQ